MRIKLHVRRSVWRSSLHGAAILGAAVLLLGITACSSPSSSTPSGAAVQNGQRPLTTAAPLANTAGSPAGTVAAPRTDLTTASGPTVINMTASNFSFAPNSLGGRPGEKVSLTLRNSSSTLHNFSSTAIGVDRDIPANGSLQIDFSVPFTGPITFFCKYHQGSGMTGQVQVTGAPAPPDGRVAPAAAGG